MSGVTYNGVNMTWPEYMAMHKRKKVLKRHLNIVNKLIIRLNNELNMDIPLNTTITQINPTKKQLSMGSFKWVFDGNFSRYGSTVSISELLRAGQLEVSYITSGGLSTLPSSLIDIQPC